MNNFSENFILLITISGTISLHEEKSVQVIKDFKEIFDQLYLQDLQAWEEKKSVGLYTFQNEKQDVNFLSKISISPHREITFENERLVNKTLCNLVLDTKSTPCEFEKTDYTKELKILQNLTINNFSCENKNGSQVNLFEVAHCRVKGEHSKPVSENKKSIGNIATKIENYFNDSNENILKRYIQGEPKSLFHHMTPTKSSLFQYFSSSEPIILRNFYSDLDFHHFEEDVIPSAKHDFQTDHLFNALKNKPNYETLEGISTFDKRVMVSSNLEHLEASFTTIDSRITNINQEHKNIISEISSSRSIQDSTSLRATPAMSISDSSEYSDSSSESGSEISDSAESREFISTCCEQLPNSASHSAFTSPLYSHSAYSTSPILEFGVSWIFSSSATFDENF